MSQGNIIEWMKKVRPGDRVEAGEVFCEVETDKATVAWESTEEGYLAQVRRDGDRLLLGMHSETP
eukprot:scaffold50941_cov18-Tisochrysis_lutea.AAC.1